MQLLKKTHISLIKQTHNEMRNIKDLEQKLYLKQIRNKSRQTNNTSKRKDSTDNQTKLITETYQETSSSKFSPKFYKTSHENTKTYMSRFDDRESRMEFRTKQSLTDHIKYLKLEDIKKKSHLYHKERQSRIDMLNSKEINWKSKIKQRIEVKTYNKLIKENIEILKEKTLQENKQKKVIIQAKDEIIKKAIEQYIEKKQEVINMLCEQDLKKNLQIKKQLKNNIKSNE